jgi:hypothetical protein
MVSSFSKNAARQNTSGNESPSFDTRKAADVKSIPTSEFRGGDAKTCNVGDVGCNPKKTRGIPTWILRNASELSQRKLLP